MRNRAKCKLCQTVIESFHRHDFVTCKCGEISIDGGNDHFHCGSKNWSNFLRIDDFGNEVEVKIQDKDEPTDIVLSPMPEILTKKEKLEMLERMADNIKDLPPNAMQLPINHYDFYSLIIVLASILKEEIK